MVTHDGCMTPATTPEARRFHEPLFAAGCDDAEQGLPRASTAAAYVDGFAHGETVRAERLANRERTLPDRYKATKG